MADILALWNLRFADEPPVMLLIPDDEPRGYLIPFQKRTSAYHVLEVAADDWPATLALLQYSAQLVEKTPDPPKEVLWPLPPNSSTLYLLADNVAVRSETHRILNVGWMACPVFLDTYPMDRKVPGNGSMPTLLGIWLHSNFVERTFCATASTCCKFVAHPLGCFSHPKIMACGLELKEEDSSSFSR